ASRLTSQPVPAMSPRSRRPATARLTSAASRPATNTRQPSSKNRRAAARPIPLLPPLTRTRLPASPRIRDLLRYMVYDSAWRNDRTDRGASEAKDDRIPGGQHRSRAARADRDQRGSARAVAGRAGQPAAGAEELAAPYP